MGITKADALKKIRELEEYVSSRKDNEGHGLTTDITIVRYAERNTIYGDGLAIVEDGRGLWYEGSSRGSYVNTRVFNAKEKEVDCNANEVDDKKHLKVGNTYFLILKCGDISSRINDVSCYHKYLGDNKFAYLDCGIVDTFEPDIETMRIFEITPIE